MIDAAVRTRCTVARTKRSPSSPVALSSLVEVSRTIFSLSRTRFVYKDKSGKKATLSMARRVVRHSYRVLDVPGFSFGSRDRCKLRLILYDLRAVQR